MCSSNSPSSFLKDNISFLLWAWFSSVLVCSPVDLLPATSLLQMLWKKLVEASFGLLFLWFHCNLLLPFWERWCPSHFQSTDSDHSLGITHNVFAQSLDRYGDFCGNMNINLDRQVTDQFFQRLILLTILLTTLTVKVWSDDSFFWDVIKTSCFVLICILCCSVLPFTPISCENWPDLRIAYGWP